MSTAEHPEERRLEVLRGLGLLDTPVETDFERLTELARRVLRAPTALVSLVDRDRQWFKSAVGLGEPWATRRETPLTHSFCKIAVATKKPLIVYDAKNDARVRDSLAIPELGVAAYAGIPLVADDEVVGAFCVVDSEPRSWTTDEISLLTELARNVEHLISLRRANTEVMRLHTRLHEQNLVYQQALGHMPDVAVAVFNRELRILAAEGAPLERLGMVPREMVGKLAKQVHTPSNYPRLEKLYLDALKGIETREELTRNGGRYAISVVPLKNAHGVVETGMWVLYDITERHRETLILRTLVRSLPNTAVALFDEELKYIFADGSMLETATGFTPEQMLGKHLSEALQPTEPGETRGLELYQAALKGQTTRRELHRNGRNYEHLIVPVRGDDGRIVAGLALLYDVSERKERQRALQDVLETLAHTAELLRQASITDALTGLHNRRGFIVLAEQAMRTAKRNTKPMTILFFDLNGMKPINDQLGHEMGDRALIETANVLRASFRASDILCRLGGDEFAVLATDSGHQGVPELEQRIAKHVAAFNEKRAVPFTLSVSVGSVVWEPGDDTDLDVLLAKADALMYEVKRKRKAAG